MGVSGSGKTTIGKILSLKTGIPFFDADDYHDAASKEKMRTGQPLTDEDRQEWLLRINQLAKKQMQYKGAIIACSALKEKYRSILQNEINTSLFWIFLKGSYELIERRMKERTDHYMPATLLNSQFAILETPTDAITIDIAQEPADIVDQIIRTLQF